jgi:hypothetical protein
MRKKRQIPSKHDMRHNDPVKCDNGTQYWVTVTYLMDFRQQCQDDKKQQFMLLPYKLTWQHRKPASQRVEKKNITKLFPLAILWKTRLHPC